jgi:hypothetical protein
MKWLSDFAGLIGAAVIASGGIILAYALGFAS